MAIVRAAERRAAIAAQFSDWTFTSGAYGAFAIADMLDAPDGFTVRALIGDDDNGTDWGDIDPSDEERENAASYYAAVIVLDASGAEIYHDGIGGVDVIDLPGYDCRTWEDAALYALDDYLLRGALDWLANETSESAEWAARDTITVAR